MRTTSVAVLLAGLIGLAGPAGAEEPVAFASQDRNASGAPVMLNGHWFASHLAPAPAVLEHYIISWRLK